VAKILAYGDAAMHIDYAGQPESDYLLKTLLPNAPAASGQPLAAADVQRMASTPAVLKQVQGEQPVRPKLPPERPMGDGCHCKKHCAG
jgi:hypothetical protein